MTIPNNKKKISFLIGKLKDGGSERVVANLSTAMSKEDLEVDIVVFEDVDSDYDIGSKVKILQLVNVGQNKISTLFNTIILLKQYVLSHKPNALIPFSTSLNVLCLIAKIWNRLPVKIIISERNHPYYSVTEFYYKALRKILYRCADGAVFQTQEIRDYFSRSLSKKSTIIENPVIIPRISETTVRCKRIVSVGRLVSQKNHKLLIDAFKILLETNTEYELVIYGEGELRPQLEDYIYSLDLNSKVLMPGRMNNVLSIISTASLYVNSSNYEGMSNSLMEAMALGVPCISTNSKGGGAAALIKNGVNGILTPVNDKQALANAMRTVISNKKLMDTLSANSRKILKSHSIDSVSNQWIQYFKSIV